MLIQVTMAKRSDITCAVRRFAEVMGEQNENGTRIAGGLGARDLKMMMQEETPTSTHGTQSINKSLGFKMPSELQSGNLHLSD